MDIEGDGVLSPSSFPPPPLLPLFPLIPLSLQVSGIVEQIIKYGKVTRPVLGISFAPEQAVEQLGVSGVLVLDAPPSGPAGKAVSPVQGNKQAPV